MSDCIPYPPQPCIQLESAWLDDFRCKLGTRGCTEAHARGQRRFFRSWRERLAWLVREATTCENCR